MAAEPQIIRTDILQDEIVRLNRVILALMDHAESSGGGTSDFGSFQLTIMLEDEVRRHTAEMRNALLENERITRQLRDSEEKFRVLVSHSVVGIYILEDGRLIYCNQRALDMFGFTEEDIAQRPDFLAIVAQPDRELAKHNYLSRISGTPCPVSYTIQVCRQDGAVIDTELHCSRIELGGKPYVIGMSLDVTERLRAERELRQLQQKLQEQATHDPLTGLYNRLFLNENFERELIAARRHHYPVAIILGDLDHFKNVNDKFGHLAGDAVLRAFARILRQQVRASDLFCRYGGEEFLLVLPRMSLQLAVERAERLRAELAAASVSFEEHKIAITASFGVASFPRNGETPHELIGATDQALYEAKRLGRNHVVASPPRHHAL